MEIEYYSSDRGDCEILNFISLLNDQKHKKAIVKSIELLQKWPFSELLKTKVIEKIHRDPPIYELKCHFGKNIYRILFGIRITTCHLLLIFPKKDQKIRYFYINKAISRFKSL